MMNRLKKPLLVLMAGSSGSGKSTVAEEILKRLPKHISGTVICQDRYYLDFKKMNKSLKDVNFDHPKAFDWKLMKKHLHDLINNKSVKLPVYNYVDRSRESNKDLVNPCDVIIFEGIHSFYDDEINKLSDLMVFVDTSKDESFIRRLERDVKSRGRKLDNVISQWRDTVRPMYDAFIEPLKYKADIITPWSDSQRKAVEIISSWIINLHKKNELLLSK